MIDLVGEQYGRLTVKTELSRIQRYRRRFLCECTCGGSIETELSGLRSGNTASCGCLRREVTSQRTRTHGMCSRTEYNIWNAMKQRCNNPHAVNYERYGGAGIRVCKKWEESFEAFFAHVGPRPSHAHSLERKKNELGYQPGNVVWATSAEQRRNTKQNVWVEMDGRRQILKDWCRELGIASYKLASERIIGGWDKVAAITTPAGIPGRHHGKKAA
jgi:hypothetical protein